MSEIRKTTDDVNLTDEELVRVFTWFNYLAGEDAIEAADTVLARRFAGEISKRGCTPEGHDGHVARGMVEHEDEDG